MAVWEQRRVWLVRPVVLGMEEKERLASSGSLVVAVEDGEPRDCCVGVEDGKQGWLR